MLNCPGCGAPMRLEDGRDSLVCDYCKQVCVPEANDDGVRILGESSDLACPVCAVPLVPASLARHRILYCTHCRGSLIVMGEFGALIGDLRAEAHGATASPHAPGPRELERRIRCPKCGELMDTHFYCGPGNIVIDDCSHCEVNWLDAGELRIVSHAPDHSYTAESRTISDYGTGFDVS